MSTVWDSFCRMKVNSTKIALLILALAGALLFLPFLGYVNLFDWDEANFAEAAREMLVTNDYLTVQIDFRPFWEKPPLFIWLQALSMKLFGVNEFAARFPNAIAGILTLMVLFLMGKKTGGNTMAWLWPLVYAGSLLPHFYFKSGIIDPWFNLFIFSGIYFISITDNRGQLRWNNAAVSGMLAGLAVLTKGPVGLLIFGLTWFVILLVNRFRGFPSLKSFISFGITVILFGGAWFVVELFNGRFDIIHDFIVYQARLFSTRDAGHGGPFYYHFIVVLFGCFPASVLAMPNLRKNIRMPGYHGSFALWMLVLLGVVLVLFSIVRTKIIHYSSLAYFPVSYLAALNLAHIVEGQTGIKKWLAWVTGTISFMLSIGFLAVPLVLMNRDFFIENDFITGQFARACLSIDLSWYFYHLLPGLLMIAGNILFIAYARKKAGKAMIFLFFASLLTVSASVVLLAPKIEKIVQRPAIDFYREHSDGTAYVKPLGFKSYAYLFYTNKQKPENLNHGSKEWLLSGPVDRPVFFVVRVTEAKKHEEWFPSFEKLYQKGGFVFYKREKAP